MINAKTKTLLFVLPLLGHSIGIDYILTMYENQVVVSFGYFQKQVSPWAAIALTSFRTKFSD